MGPMSDPLRTMIMIRLEDVPEVIFKMRTETIIWRRSLKGGEE